MEYKSSIFLWNVGGFQVRSAKLRKANIRFIISVCPSVHLFVCLSVRVEQLGSDRKDFDEIWHLSIFRKNLLRKIQFSIKSDKITG
jgi:hypothetical protein